MNLSIIIVSWNVKNLLFKCLESIFKYTQGLAFEVIVIDNCSQDGTVEFIASKFPQVNLIINNYNVGFAKANNQGIETSGGRYLAFLNPDTELTENSLQKMVDFMETRPAVQMSTCKLINQDGSRQNNIKRDPSFFSQLLIILKLHHFFSNFQAIQDYLAKDFNYAQIQKVEQIMGAFMLARRETILKLQGFAENYWLWWEEVDLCTRLRQGGWQIFYTPDTSIIHHEGESFAQILGFEKQKIFIQGLKTYWQRYGQPREYLIFKIITPLSLFLAWLTQILKIKARPQSKI